jgi:uncharacterized membrane protein
MAQEQFTTAQKKFIVNAIKQAELNTSGEIRVHVENKCKINVLDRAADVFAMLKMHKTAQRNGVLFYLATGDKQFAILGDAGINAKVPNNFWESIKEEMQQHFKKGDFTKGLVVGIEMAGEKLKQFFPYQTDDVNELPDDISYGNQ